MSKVKNIVAQSPIKTA